MKGLIVQYRFFDTKKKLTGKDCDKRDHEYMPPLIEITSPVI